MIARAWLSGSLLSVAAVLWMGWRLLEHDRALEWEQQRQAMESVADAAAAVLEKSVLEAEQAMLSDSWSPAPGAVVVRWRAGRLASAPQGTLLFAPVVVESRTNARLFADAEKDEFADRDLAKVEARYRELASARDADVRAGALVRQARVLAKRGDAGGAEDCYRRLAGLASARFEEVPAPLVAHLARRDGPALAAALDRPGILPSLAAYLFHAGQATELTQGRWKPDPVRLRLSEAVAMNWPAASGGGRRSDGEITLLLRREGADVTVMAATAEYVRAHWAARAEAVAAQAGARLRIGPAGSQAVTRTGPVTGLPWTIGLDRDPVSAPTLYSGRRRLIAIGTLALAAMLLATGYFTHRALHRELAAARMQSDFVAAVSHEFRTPLTALRQFTDMLIERATLTDAQRRTCYEAQLRSTERLSRLVESLLDFRRMEAGARPYVLESVDAAAPRSFAARPGRRCMLRRRTALGLRPMPGRFRSPFGTCWITPLNTPPARRWNCACGAMAAWCASASPTAGQGLRRPISAAFSTSSCAAVRRRNWG
jgi:signal transduction histidine kinase